MYILPMAIVVTEGDGWELHLGLLVYFHIDGLWILPEPDDIGHVDVDEEGESR